MTFDQFYSNVKTQILNPAIAILFTFAFLMFIVGIIRFIKDADNEEARQTGKRHMIWGVAGMAIMVAAYAIVQVIQTTVLGL